MEDMPIRRIMVHGEKAAAYMADGYARASRKPGVCMAQMIGASNLAAGLRDGFMAGAPIIAVTGGPTPQSRYRHAYQEVDDVNQFDAVTKFNAQVDHVTRMPDMTERVKPVRRIVVVDENDRSRCIADGPSPDVRTDPARPGYASTNRV